ncbi:MAG: IS4 family transposase [Tannerellaceae bacterium]|nr:IS4 family transposase [Tannerellaceae bacterium]
MRNFLIQTIENPVLLNKYRLSPQSFTRKRTLCFDVVVMLILNMLKRSLQVELHDFFDHFPAYCSCSKQALSAQRGKLSHLFYHDWNTLLIKKFYQYNAPGIKRRKGMRIYSVDGSSVTLPFTGELATHYGLVRHRSGGTPTARVSVLYDVLNELVIKSGLYPFCTSERHMAQEYIDYMHEDTILLFDRGYPSFWFIYLMILNKPSSFFLMRLRLDFSRQIKKVVEANSKDTFVELCGSAKSINKLSQMGISIPPQTKIKLRVVCVGLPTGEKELLLTNLMDKTRYTARDLKELYHMRWGVEKFYGCMKNQLQLKVFSGIRPICIEQDFAANMFLFNLQSLIQKQCEPYLKAVSKKRKYTYKINRNIALARMKYRVVELFVKDKVEILLKMLQKCFEQSLQAIRPDRNYPHKRKVMFDRAKHRTLTNYKRAI